MTYHPKLPCAEVKLDPERITIQYLLDVFRTCARGQKDGILEWGRLNPTKISEFFRAFLRDIGVSKKYRSLYEQLRMVCLRVLNENPVSVPAIEDNLERYQDDELAKRQAALNDIRDKIQELRYKEYDAYMNLKEVKEEIALGNSVDRSKWKGPEQPSPRATSRPDGPRDQSRQSSRQPPRRRGSSLGDRVESQEPPGRPVFPEKRSSLVFSGSGWRDDEECDLQGLMINPITSKRKTPSPLSVPQEEREVRMVVDEQLIVEDA